MSKIEGVIAMDILSVVLGAAAKSVADKTWSVGEKWLQSYFAAHHLKSIEKAENNAKAFVNMLAEKIARLEEQLKVDHDIIDRALDEPSFGALLHSALISSAQTEIPEKHNILASLIADKFRSQPESLDSLALTTSCEAIGKINIEHLRLLAWVCLFRYLGFPFSRLDFSDGDTFLLECNNWMAGLIGKIGFPEADIADLIYLESIGCVKYTPSLDYGMSGNLSDECSGDANNDSVIQSFPISQTYLSKWNELELGYVWLTHAGQIIGIHALELFTQSNLAMYLRSIRKPGSNVTISGGSFVENSTPRIGTLKGYIANQ